MRSIICCICRSLHRSFHVSTATTSTTSLSISFNLASFSASTSRLVQYKRVGGMPSDGKGFVTVLQASSDFAVDTEQIPTRTSLRNARNLESPCCRCGVRSSAVLSLELAHAGDSNAKPLVETGGSWRKSPQTKSCTPPNGLVLPRTTRSTTSRSVNKSASIIEISSSTRTSVSPQRKHASKDFCT